MTENMLNNANKDRLFQFLSKKFQATTADANLHIFITKADQLLSNKPAVMAVSLCKHGEADTSVSSTWNMPLIRGTIKPTSEQWTHVWLSLPSCDCWTAWSTMQPSSVPLSCLHRVWFAFINVWHCLKMDEICCLFFMLQIPLSPWPKTQAAVSPLPRIWHVWNTGLCWCRPKTVIKPLSVKPENGLPPMARSRWTQYHQHRTLCSNIQTCIDGRCFHKDAKLSVPLYEAGNGMAGPRHEYLAWLSYLTLAGLLFAVALWMYSCVHGNLHVAPCWDLTKHLL